MFLFKDAYNTRPLSEAEGDLTPKPLTKPLTRPLIKPPTKPLSKPFTRPDASEVEESLNTATISVV